VRNRELFQEHFAAIAGCIFRRLHLQLPAISAKSYQHNCRGGLARQFKQLPHLLAFAKGPESPERSPQPPKASSSAKDPHQLITSNVCSALYIVRASSRYSRTSSMRKWLAKNVCEARPICHGASFVDPPTAGDDLLDAVDARSPSTGVSLAKAPEVRWPALHAEPIKHH
jgi:hypothetical protein